MEQHIEKLIDMPPEDLMGPAMLRLNSRQRRFVVALSVLGGSQHEAYIWAGYTASSDNAAYANSSRLMQHKDVIEAIKEECFRRLDSASLMSVSTLVELASPRQHDAKVRLKAAVEIMNRTGFHSTSEHHIVVKDKRTTAELIQFIKDKAGAHGLDANKLLGLPAPSNGPIIDVEAETVYAGGTDGIEDLF